MTNLQSLILKLTRARRGVSPSLWKTKFEFLFGISYDKASTIEVPNPFKELPNISSLKIRVRTKDPLLDAHSVSKKISPEMTFAVLSHRIKSANRYMKFMHWKLSSLLKKGDFHGFWILALKLMQDSSVLRAVALRKWDLNWHRNYSFSTVKQILGELNRLIETLPWQLHIVRNYADKIKPDGRKTYRPIGNPAYSARMFLYMWQCFLVMFVSGYVSHSQHAYFPGRGVVTALQELETILKTEDLPFAWEYDLKGAFPSLSIPETCRALSRIGIPSGITDYLRNLALATIERVDLSPPDQYRLLPEPKFDRQEAISTGMIPSPRGYDLKTHLPVGSTSKTKSWLEETIESMESSMGYALSQEEIEYLYKEAGKQRTASCAMEDWDDELDGSSVPLPLRGFPQGAATSPVIFNFAFEYSVRRGHFLRHDPSVRILSYADDFIAWSQKSESYLYPWLRSQTMKRFGVQFAEDKCQSLISDGRWQVSKFKFLGVTLHVQVGKLVKNTPILWEGTPRSGKHLLFNKDEMIRNFEFRNEQLAKFISHFEISPPTVEKVLQLWSDDEGPSRFLPPSILKGEMSVDSSLLRRIEELEKGNFTRGDMPGDIVDFKSSSRLSDSQIRSWARTQIDWGEDLASNLNPSLSIETLRKEYFLRRMGSGPSSDYRGSAPKVQEPFGFSGSPKSWLQVPELSGMVASRLHGGSWSVEQDSANLSLKPKAPRSYLELALKTCVDRPFRSLPHSLKNWVIDLPQTAELAKKFEQGFDWKKHTDPWVKVFLNQLRVGELSPKVVNPHTLAGNVSIYNSSSYATLASLSFIRDPKSYRISRKTKSFKV